MQLSRRCAGVITAGLVAASFVTPVSMECQRVVNSGVPGANSAEIAASGEPAILGLRPSVVIVFAGTNDALNEKKFLTAGETRLALLRLGTAARQAGVRQLLFVRLHQPDSVRLLQRHSPAEYAASTPQQRIELANRSVNAAARQLKATVVPWDRKLAGMGGASTELSTDGVHLTAAGYRALAEAVRRCLPRKLPSTALVLCLGDSLTYGIGVRAAGTPETPDTYPMQLGRLLHGTQPPLAR